MQKTGAVGAAAILFYFVARVLGSTVPGAAAEFFSQILSAGLPLLLLLLPAVRTEPLPHVSLPDKRGWTHLIYLPIFLLVVLLASYLSTLLAGLFGITAPEVSGTPVTLFFNYALAPALAEEFFFRFLLLRLFLPYGKTTAIWLSSILFALFHMNLAQIPYAFAAGLFLGTVALSAGSIWIPILFHLVNNSLSLVSTFGGPPLSLALIGLIALSSALSLRAVRKRGPGDDLSRDLLALVKPTRETGQALAGFSRTLLVVVALLCIVLSFLP